MSIPIRCRRYLERELSAGLAEVIKHGVLADSEYFDVVEKDISQLQQKDEVGTDQGY